MSGGGGGVLSCYPHGHTYIMNRLLNCVLLTTNLDIFNSYF